MTPEEPEDDPRRRPPKSPFDELFKGFGLDPREFDRMFQDVQRNLQDMLKNMGGLEPGKPYVHGFSFKIGPDGKPQVSEFGHRPQAPKPGTKAMISEEREPLTDVIDERDQIAVTVELPGVDKKDIDIRVTEQELEINVDTAQRKYHKLVKLPAPVQPTTTKASHRNGILDVTVKKEKPSPPKAGHRVKVE